jgi:adenylyltransferase/sulfurtransferase
MSIIIEIPTPLRRFTSENAAVDVEAASVGQAMQQLVAKHPDLRAHLYDGAGKLRTFVNLFLNDEDVRYMDKEGTAVSDGDRLSIIPSIAGGSPAIAGGLGAAR